MMIFDRQLRVFGLIVVDDRNHYLVAQTID
jgi:hypothetical protein